MKNKVNISTGKRLLLIFFAAFVSMYIIGQQPFQHHFPKQEKEKKEQKSEEIVSVSCEAIVPFLQVSLHHGLYFIFEKVQEEDHQIVSVPVTPLFNNSFFNTLFRLIISPNAP